MKTTVELPDQLMRKVKIRAAQQGRKLKDLLAEVITRGLARMDEPQARSSPPRPPEPAVLQNGKSQTIDDIEAAIASGRA